MATSVKSKSTVKKGHQQRYMDEVEVKAALMKIESAIADVYARKNSQLSFEELYRNAYNLVLQKHGASLYSRVEACFRKHLDDQRLILIETKDPYLLESLAQIWQDQRRSLFIIKGVLMYMEKNPDSESQLTVTKLGMVLFLDIILRDEDLYGRILAQVLDRIGRKRRGEVCDLSSVKTFHEMLKELDDSRRVVELLFETPVLSASKDYFESLASELISRESIDVYLKHVEKRLADELTMAGENFPDMRHKLGRLVLDELITKHGNEILRSSSGFITMLRENKLDDLQLLFRMLQESLSAHFYEAAKLFGEFIGKVTLDILLASSNEDAQSRSTKVATAAETNEEGAPDAADTGGATEAASSSVSLSQIAVSVISSLLNEKEKFEIILRQAFRSDKLFEKFLKEALETALNTDARCAQYLAIYCDELLTGKLSESKSSNLEGVIDRAMGLFRFFSDKDVFEAYYKQYLAKRLFGNRSISEDAERTVITRLKAECGHQFTSKLEGMFKDLALSQDTSNRFRDLHGSSLPIEFSVAVLASGFWPASVHYQGGGNIHLPSGLESVRSKFEEFYNQIHTGRRITWNYALGAVEMKVHGFRAGFVEFTVSPLQCIAMHAFDNTRRSLTFGQLLEITGIPRDDLKRHMISMALPRVQIFTKTGHKKVFLDEDVYEFNPDFRSRSRKMKVPLVSMPNSSDAPTLGFKDGEKDSVGAIPESVNETRKYIIEATIVRIMKSRKSLEHNNLMAEVFRQVRFKPTPTDVKRRIESLIEREYLARDHNDMRTYTYLA